MNATAFAVMNHQVTWAAVIGAVAIAQWLVLASMASFAPSKKPKSGMRKSDVRLIVSSALFGALALVAFDGMALVHWKPSTPTTAAAVVAPASHASCVVVQPEMTAAQLEAKLGKPDEIRPNDEVRGPGATLWIYRDARCAVALFDGKVEMTE